MQVFLSHSTKDADFVERLALALGDNGFTPWRCEVDIDKGENFVARINDGLAESQIALLVWSPDAARSGWTKEEWTAALLGRVEGQKMRLGLIMLREHADYPLPPLLRTTNYIDARWDQAAGIRDTITWLKGRQNLQRLSGSKAPVYLPEYRPKDFVGRSAYLAKLSDAFFPEPGKFLLYGEPGSGKSTIALQFAWDAQKDLDAVIWQTCGQRSLDAITAELVERLPIDVKTLPPDKQREAAKTWLRERQSLLILDDVWLNEKGVFELGELEPGPACSVLYTSRMHRLPEVVVSQSLQVDKFSDNECEQLFRRLLVPTFSEEEVDRNRDVLLGFACSVDMLPIAVSVGTCLLLGMEATPLGEGALTLRVDDLVDGVRSDDNRRNVHALFRKAMESQPEREQKLLAACAACVQEGFWLPLAAEIAEIDLPEARKSANQLVGSSLLRVVDRERQRFQMHALLRDEARRKVGPNVLKTLQEQHAVALEELFKDWEKRWQECRECLEETIPAAEGLHQQGRSAWPLVYWGWDLGRRTGELDVALRIMQQEEKCARTSGDRGILQASYGNQALILKAWGRLEEALALHKKEEAICLELGNKDGLQISYGNQALILKAWGRLEEALALHKKKEAICLELGNKDGLQACYGNQALILKAWGRLEEALALHKKEEAICLELGNKDGLQASYGNQALILDDWGRLEEALALHKKKEAICLELGNRDSLQRSYGNQALILYEWGRLEEALELHKKQEVICLELGNKNDLQGNYGNQALILKAWGRLEEALALHKKEEAIGLELGNKDGLQLSYCTQANILRQWGRLDEALNLYRKQETICLELGSKYGLGYCYWNWGLLARAQGDHATEKQKLQQALALFTELNMPRERDAVQAELDEIDSE